MPQRPVRGRRSAYTAAGAALVLTVCTVLYPEDAFNASLRGLKLWFEIVLPALFPFFTLAQILMGLGVVQAFGVILEPVMRPIFRIPGTGALTVAIGLASGYPLGAKMTGELRRAGLCGREEGERIVSFANTADPLFLGGAAAVGMFGNAALGAVLVMAHYLSVFCVGFLMRFHAGGVMTERPVKTRRKGLLTESLLTLAKARQEDGRPLGQVFGDAVRDSLQSMLFVGGCIMMFSVVLRVLDIAGVTGAVAWAVGLCLQPFGVDPTVIDGLVKGLVEITLGTQTVATSAAPLAERLAVVSAIIAWSGLSVHAQVAAMLHGTDLRLRPYVLARMLHGVLAAGFTLLLLGPLGTLAQPVSVPLTEASLFMGGHSWMRSVMDAGGWLIGCGCLIAGAAAVVGAKVRLIRVRKA